MDLTLEGYSYREHRADDGRRCWFVNADYVDEHGDVQHVQRVAVLASERKAQAMVKMLDENLAHGES